MIPGHPLKPSGYQTGLTLVEIMIALLLGIFLTAGILSVFLSNKQTVRLNDSLARMQEDGRMVMENFGSHIRTAGYGGCYGDLSQGVNSTLNANAISFLWNLNPPIQGFNDVNANVNLSGIATSTVANTDILVIRGMGVSTPLSAASTTTQFTVNTPNDITKHDILLVTDCEHAALFQATGASTTGNVTTITHSNATGFNPGNNSANIAQIFNPVAQIGRLESRIYNIQNGANGRPALFEGRLQAVDTNGDGVPDTVQLNLSELIPNTANLQLTYGVDTNRDKSADQYQDASAVADWANVVSVRFALLLESDEDNQIPQLASYSFDPATFNYIKDTTTVQANANRRFRRVFSGVVAIRNRVL